jgi:hypothetical protein
VRGFLINKNLCFYYWLIKRIGKKRVLGVANRIEKAILVFGREQIVRDCSSLRIPYGTIEQTDV